MALHWLHFNKLISLEQVTKNYHLKTVNRNSMHHYGLCSSCIILIIVIEAYLKLLLPVRQDTKEDVWSAEPFRSACWLVWSAVILSHMCLMPSCPCHV